MISASAPASPATTRAAAWNARPTPSQRGKPCVSLERDHLRRALALRGNVAARPVDDRLEEERERQAERVIEPAREGHRLAGARERRVGLAEVPEVPRGIDQRGDALIVAEHPDEPVVLRRIVESDRPLAVRERGRELPLVVLGGRDVRMPEERLLPVATRLGRRQHLGRQRSPALDLAAIVVADRQPRARHAEPRRVARRRAPAPPPARRPPPFSGCA